MVWGGNPEVFLPLREKGPIYRLIIIVSDREHWERLFLSPTAQSYYEGEMIL